MILFDLILAKMHFLSHHFMPLMCLFHEMHCNRIINARVIKQLMLMSSILNLVDDGNKGHIDNSGCEFVLDSIFN